MPEILQIDIPTFLIEEMERKKRENKVQIPLYLPIPEYPIDDTKEEDEDRVSESRIIVINM